MKATDKPVARQRLPAAARAESREQNALREVGQTNVARGTAVALVAIFLSTVLAVPAVQFVHEIRSAPAGGRARLLPQGFAIMLRLPSIVQTFGAIHGTLWQRARAANRQLARDIAAHESAVEDESIVANATLPATQAVLSALGAGNEKVYIGREDWLFYRPDVDHLTAPGFLEHKRLRQRADEAGDQASTLQSDPRRAIFHFRDQLALRGIQLVLMPTPSKASIHPEKLTPSAGTGDAIPQNASYARWLEELAAAGVLVFDPRTMIAEARRETGRAQYLATDTHWRPEAMELAADNLAVFLRENVPLPAHPAIGFTEQPMAVSNRGDVAVMLRLPAEYSRFGPESVPIRQVRNEKSEPWRPDQGSDVLLLGDSFSNIYSLEAMGWGKSAGLAERLSMHLQRPVDCILRNDEGAHATRTELARELARGNDRLAGKRVVIWQFAVRELSNGDWKLIDLRVGKPSMRNFLVPPPGETWTVTAVVEQVSAVPRPGSVPYKDHILAVHLKEVMREDDAASSQRDALVYLWSMQNNSWTSAARLQPGDSVHLELQSWSNVSAQFDRFNRSELLDEGLLLEEPCWGEPVDE